MTQQTSLKVAIAGTGNVAQYFIEELKAFGHHVVVFTRSQKPEDDRFEQRVTDYSIPSLVNALQSIDALVSTVSDYSDLSKAVQAHLNMLEAVKQSETVRSFLPSTWTLNEEEYPEHPMALAGALEPLYHALRETRTLRWSIISISWFMDYIIPSKNRHLRDLGDLFPMDHDAKVFTIYGPGDHLINMTSARDVGKAVAALIASPEPWEEYIYMSGSQLTWNEMFEIIKKRDPEWTSRNKSLAATVKQYADNTSPESALVASFELHGYAGALTLPKEKVERHRAKYFPNIKFQTFEELLDEAAARPDHIV